MKRIPIVTNVLESNQSVANDVRRAIRPVTLVLNLLSSPGAGKTSLIERTVAALEGELQFAVIEGDLTTTLDAERVAQHDVPVVQINTAGGCHLEARQVMAALQQLAMKYVDVLIVENVGNLVCPVEFDLGEDAKIVITSLTEGDDKPLKYPGAFVAAQAIVVNKIDLEPYLPVSIEKLRAAIATINRHTPVIALSCTTGTGFGAWLDWVRAALRAKRARV